MENREETIEAIHEVLGVIRPYIQSDGGDVEFVDLTEEGIVQIRLLGACVGCGLIDVTVGGGIEQSLVEEVPGILGVDLIQDNWV